MRKFFVLTSHPADRLIVGLDVNKYTFLKLFTLYFFDRTCIMLTTKPRRERYFKVGRVFPKLKRIDDHRYSGSVGLRLRLSVAET